MLVSNHWITEYSLTSLEEVSLYFTCLANMLLIGKAAESKQVKQEVNRRYSETSPYEVNTFLSSLIPSVRQGKKKIAMEAFWLAFNFFRPITELKGSVLILHILTKMPQFETNGKYLSSVPQHAGPCCEP